MSCAGLHANHAHSIRFISAVAAVHANFLHTDPAASESTTFIVANTSFVLMSEMLVGMYMLVPMLHNSIPTIQNFDLPGHFGFALCRVIEVNATNLVLVRIADLHDGAVTVATSPANCLASYGTLATAADTNSATRLFYRFVDPNPPRALKAIAALQAFAMSVDPFLIPVPVPQLPVVPPVGLPPPNPLAALMMQVHANHSELVTKGKETDAKLHYWSHLMDLSKACSPGTFANLLNKLMLGLPANQPPSAAYFSPGQVVHEANDRLLDFSRGITSRAITISKPRLELLVLLNFKQPGAASIFDLAMAEELPITTISAREVVLRFANVIVIPLYGLPLATAICSALNQLLQLKAELETPAMSLPDMAEVIHSRINKIQQHPDFDPTTPLDGTPPDDRLVAYFRMTHNDSDVRLMHNQRMEIEKQASAAGGGPVPIPHAKSNAKGRNKRIASTPASNTPAYVQPRVTRSMDQAAMTAWYEILFTTVPALRGVPLPCLYFLAGLGTCANNNACQKTTFKRSHVVSNLVKTHNDAIVAWLKDDPLGRF